MYHDYRQEPITSDAACEQYRAYLAKIEAMIAAQEDVVVGARANGDVHDLARARSSLWRLLTKRQGVFDAIQAYARTQG
ncbi:MAG TPA: hypothetical protein VIG30_07655 [Ktedonobacterales bacterium]